MILKRGSRSRNRTRVVAAAALALLMATATTGFSRAEAATRPHAPAASAPTVSASAANPAVTGPITGGDGAIVLQSTAFDLSSVGYEQSEYFLSGTASSYTSATALTSDGKWAVTPASTAPYTTRIVVYRPQNPAHFNGTVVVEWLNDSADLDVPATWVATHNELIRDGFAWVGVSAQQVGVDELKQADPVRYAALSHPGDSYSYDIFSQAGQAVRDQASTVLSGLTPRKVLAIGESQSAFRLTTYADAIQPLVHEYDGFLIYSREGTSAALSQAPQADVPAPSVVLFRPDLGVPVLTVETETDLIPLDYYAARQPDSADFRDWEVAGAAHADTYIADVGFIDTGNGAGDIAAFDTMLDPPTTPDPADPVITCASPINTGEAHYVVEAAAYALNLWVTRGIAPLPAPRLDITVTTGTTPTFVLDANGDAEGGIRTPSVDVPVATLSGLGQSGSSFCFLFGTTTPFTATQLAALYPTHAQFVDEWSADTTIDALRGYLRPADAANLITAAEDSTVG